MPAACAGCGYVNGGDPSYMKAVPLALRMPNCARFLMDGTNEIGLAVTEWGPWFQVDPQGRYTDHVKTLGSALYVASTLKVFVEELREYERRRAGREARQGQGQGRGRAGAEST